MFEARRLTTVSAAGLCLGLSLMMLSGQAAQAAPAMATTTTVTAVPMPQPYGVLGQTFSVTVTPADPTATSPTGSVTVSSGGTDLCPAVTLVAGGSGTGAVTALCQDTTTVVAVGDPVVAVYTPDSAQFASSKGKLIGAVSTASSTSTVGESQSGTTWGNEQSLVFTDQVVDSQPNSSGNPTGGTATIEQGTTVLCTATVSAVTVVTNGNPSTVDQGSCSPAATALAPGSYTQVTAIYDGDQDFSASTASAPVTLTVSAAPATVTATAQSMAYGGPVPALGSTIGGFVDGQSLATSGISGSPACTTPATDSSSVGSYPISCSTGSLSSVGYAFSFVAGTLTISPAATTTSVTASPTSITVTVSPQYSGTPTGTVTVSVAGTNSSCALVAQTGSASCSISAPANLASGTYPVTATYPTTGNFAGSGASGQLVVSAAASASGSAASNGSGTATATASAVPASVPPTSSGSSSSYAYPSYYSSTFAGKAFLQSQVSQAGDIASTTSGNAPAQSTTGSAQTTGSATSGTTDGRTNSASVTLVASQVPQSGSGTTAAVICLLVLGLALITLGLRRRALDGRSLAADTGTEEGAA